MSLTPYKACLPCLLRGHDAKISGPDRHGNSRRGLTRGRFSKGLPRYHRAVKYVAAYAVFGYIMVMILFLGVWCKPVSWYWKVPVPNCEYFAVLADLSSEDRPRADQLPLLRCSAMCELLQPFDYRRFIQHHIRSVDPLPAYSTVDQSATTPQKVRDCLPLSKSPSLTSTLGKSSSSPSSPSVPSSSSAPS